MRIKDLLDPRSIRLSGSARDKDDAIAQMVDLMSAGGKVSDRDAFVKGVYEREAECSTAVGEGLAIPHCKGSCVREAGLAAMTVPAGVDYKSLDGEKVNLIFMIAAPNTKDNVHVDVLSRLSTLLLDEDLRNNLLAAENVDEFISIIDRAESQKDAEERAEQGVSMSKNLLAVTACPTGIAHTYMAAEKIEKTAKTKGCTIKVETRGASGAKNILTAEEIAAADCIIIAADTKVPLERFDGKKVIQCRVSDGIGKTEELIDKAMAG